MYKNFYTIAIAVAGGFVLANLMNGQDTKGNYTDIAKSEVTKEGHSNVAWSSKDLDDLSGLQYYTPEKRSPIGFDELEAVQYTPYTKKPLMKASSYSSLKKQLASEFEDLKVIYKAKNNIADLEAIQYEPIVKKSDLDPLEGVQYEPVIKSSSANESYPTYKRTPYSSFDVSADLASLKVQLSSGYEGVKAALKGSSKTASRQVWEFEGMKNAKQVWEYEGLGNQYRFTSASKGLDDLYI